MKQVLIVEDEPDILFTLKSRLEFEGFNVASAIDGEQALQKIKEEKPDLILLDVMMPNMNGYQVCRELRNNPETQATPVIMLTAKSQESDKFWAYETGADCYVTKPFDMEELLKKIREYLVAAEETVVKEVRRHVTEHPVRTP